MLKKKLFTLLVLPLVVGGIFCDGEAFAKTVCTGREKMRKIAIIGGSGVYNPEAVGGFEKKIVKTPYGEASCVVGMLYGNRVVFLNRHGTGHSVPPHLVNYRANIWALKKLGVEEILATAAVGSCNLQMQAGDFVICDQVLDFTNSRANTFYDGKDLPVAHADFSKPYCATLGKILQNCLQDMKVKYHSSGTMVVTQGPRFESAAEVKMFAMLGGDVINMTGMPEAILAREAEMHYAAVAVITNYGAGISSHPLSHQEVLEGMQKSEKEINVLIDKFLRWNSHTDKVCQCDTAMADYGGFKV